MTWLAFTLSLLAFACFGFATDDHHHRLTENRLSSSGKARWRGCAWLALACSFGAAIAARGWVFGPILWSGAAMLAAGVVFLTLNLWPHRARGPRR